MTGSRVRPRVLVGLFLALLAVALQGVQGEEELGVGQVPSEVQCRPYIEKALKDLGTGSLEENSLEVGEGTDEDEAPPLNEQSAEPTEADNDDDNDDDNDENDKDDDNDDEKDNDDDEGQSAADHSVRERSAEDSAEDRNGGDDGADNEGENSGEDDELAADEPADDDDETASGEDADGDNDTVETVEVTSAEDAASNQSDEADDANDDEQQDGEKSIEETEDDGADESGEEQDEEAAAAALESTEEIDDNDAEEGSTEDKENETVEEGDGSTEETKEEESQEDDKNDADSGEDNTEDQLTSAEDNKDDNKSEEKDSSARDDENHSNSAADEIDSEADETQEDNAEDDNDTASLESGEKQDEDSTPDDVDGDTDNDADDVNDDDDNDGDVKEDEDDSKDGKEDDKEDDSKENSKEDSIEDVAATKESVEEVEDSPASVESPDGDDKSGESDEVKSRDRREVGEEVKEEAVEVDDGKTSKEGEDGDQEKTDATEEVDGEEEDEEGSNEEEEAEPTPEEDLIQEIEVPENLRPRDHINQLLKLDEENEEKERAIQKAADIVLRDLKRLYDTAIKPLETLYKYRDLSNRHFGDPEIFSKPLVLFMGPWSGGKSSIVNYLLDNEYKQTALRTGAEPSPAYFNILMHGEEEEILDGTQLAADWTFSGLQKFGQGMLDRLRGVRLNNKLLEKVNIVEIPGILEIRKQVQRLFPFNDACQWFIDRADIIFLVYDPAKLDVGPETEAILDQLKGREYQTRIILNKADQVKPEELMRVQGALIWNISPLMSSAEPPVMYSTSLWSLPYEAGAPTRLLYAQERAFLRDLRSAIDKRVEHKIASARRFAVRVRNHAKMVDCYLTTYYNHKSFFGNKKDISNKIIENPQDYHIYEGLSTLTNISRYDLPDPDVYRDFFRLNPLYDFQQLSSTCTYFRGCPINRLDVAIAYDLPELVGKYKKSVEAALHEGETSPPPS